MKVTKRAVNFNMTEETIKFFTEYGEGNRSKGAERAAADLEGKPRPETVRDEVAGAAQREWDWIAGLDTNERVHAAREYPPRVISAIEGRPKSAYQTQALIAIKRVAELAIEDHEVFRRLISIEDIDDGLHVHASTHIPAYLLEEFEDEHGHPLPRDHTPVHPDNVEVDPLADDPSDDDPSDDE